MDAKQRTVDWVKFDFREYVKNSSLRTIGGKGTWPEELASFSGNDVRQRAIPHVDLPWHH